MNTLHLIIHKELLILQNSRNKYKSALDRIKDIELSERCVAHVPWKKYVNNLEECIVLAQGHSAVVLYGYSRGYCLKFVSKTLMSKGIRVSYDIAGSA